MPLLKHAVTETACLFCLLRTLPVLTGRPLNRTSSPIYQATTKRRYSQQVTQLTDPYNTPVTQKHIATPAATQTDDSLITILYDVFSSQVAIHTRPPETALLTCDACCVLRSTVTYSKVSTRGATSYGCTNETQHESRTVQSMQCRPAIENSDCWFD